MEQEKRPGFWKGQFTGEPTRRQTIYDVAFGIVMPIVCLVMDPVVFRGYRVVLVHYRWLAYTFIGCEIAVLALWLPLRPIVRNAALYFAGPLLAGGLFALALHAVILPLTLRGMVFLIGFLGFTPFLTSFVYFRNAWRAMTVERNPGGRGIRFSVILAGVALMGLPPLGVLHWYYDDSVGDLVRAVMTGKIHDSRWFVD